MKRLLLFAVIPVLMMQGCDKDTDYHCCTASVTVKLHEKAGTKVTGSDESLLPDEEAVHSVQIFVFNSDGSLDCTGYDPDVTDNRFSMTLEVSTGDGKDFCALVNSGEVDVSDGSQDSLEDLMSYIDENSPSSFVMYGKTSGIDIEGDGETVTIPVHRLVSKVILGDVSADFQESTATSVTIRSIYLTNVNTAVSLGGGGIARVSDWLHQRGWSDEGTVEQLLTDDVGKTVRDGDTLGERHSFYSGPNPTTADTHDESSAFTVRHTRLVIDTDLGYYHVDLPVMESNKVYLISGAKITGEGAMTPEEHLSRSSVTFDVYVADWETGATYTENI